MTHYEQQVIDREGQARGPIDALDHARIGSRSGGAASKDRLRGDERAARVSLRSQVARLERERSAIVAERFPHVPAPVAGPCGVVGGPTLLDLGELERVRDQLAADVQALRASARERARARAPRARAAAADAAGPGQLQVRAAARAGPGAGRMRRLGGPPAARADRHARRLVAAQALVRLSVSQGVAVHARPRFTEVSIAASVRR